MVRRLREPVKYRLIAIDLDGTLLSPSGEVTPRTRAAVHAALKAGLIVTFATGRNFTESIAVLDAVDHFDSAVFVGGAMVIDTKKRQTLHRTLMAPELARDLSAFFESRGHAVLALQDTNHAGVDYLVSSDIPLSESTRHWVKVTSATIRKTPDLSTHSHDHTLRVGIVGPLQTADAMHEELTQAFGARIVSHNILVPSQNVQVLEVFDPAVNKWQGVMHVARKHNIAAHEIIAVGDDVNDLAMLTSAGLGVAMGNANPQVLAKAAKIIGHNRDDGLAVFLEELLQ